MRIHHLNCGSLCPLGGSIMDGQVGVLRRASLVCRCLLIETDSEGLVLVDTGLGMRDVMEPHPRLSRLMTALLLPRLRREETALAQVEALGYEAADVRHIILTHLDFDHAGGLQDFPEATVHVHATELEAANQRDSWLARRRYRPAQWETGVRWRIHAPEGSSWFGFPAVRDLPGTRGDILMIPLVGHTHGHCGVAVREDSGRWLLNAGDAYFHHQEMPHTRGTAPHCPPGLRAYQTMMEVDRPSRLRSQQRLRELIQSQTGQLRLFCSHDLHELAHLGRGEDDLPLGDHDLALGMPP